MKAAPASHSSKAKLAFSGRHDPALIKALLRSFNYDPSTGSITRLHLSGPAKPGPVGNTPSSGTDGGYLRFEAFGFRFTHHRFAVLFMTGAWPTDYVDHANGDRTDNRWDNLRLCNNSLNQANSKKKSGTALPFKGVRFRDGQYSAQIYRDGKRYDLGSFSTPEQASRAYDRSASELFGEFARLNHV